MNFNDPTKTIHPSDRYPGMVNHVNGRLIRTYTVDSERELPIEKPSTEEQPSWVLYVTALWIAISLLGALFAFDAGWRQRQIEIDKAAASKGRTIEFPLNEVTKP